MVITHYLDSLDEARKWVEEIGVDSFEILGVIGKQNIRPLVRAIKNVIASVRSASAARKA